MFPAVNAPGQPTRGNNGLFADVLERFTTACDIHQTALHRRKVGPTLCGGDYRGTDYRVNLGATWKTMLFYHSPESPPLDCTMRRERRLLNSGAITVARGIPRPGDPTEY